MNLTDPEQRDPTIVGRLRPDDRFNRRLAELTHPPDWVNPRPRGRYNLIVIGGGTAGLVAAAGAAGLGAKVALVERHWMGGDCLNFGCVPSKALIRCARAAHDARTSVEFGVRVSGSINVDFAAVMERMRRVRAQLAPHDSAARFKELGVDVFLGEGRFTGRDALKIDDHSLQFARACIATGSRPTVPPIAGLADAGFLTNETVFSLTSRPARLGILGGGPIGCELAQAFARFGVEVHLIEMAPQILGREDPDAAGIVAGALRSDGVQLYLESKLRSVEKLADGKGLQIDTPAGPQNIQVDEILVGVGRLPNLERLGLDAAGVVFDPRSGIIVDDFLRTSNPRIYAAGDVCFRYKFTHVADALARIVIQNALFFGRAKASSLIIPWCTFTDPEVAHVGMYESEAKDAGIATQTLRVDFREIDRAVLDGDEGGFLKILVRRGSGRILGATLVARHAGEMISEITAMMVCGAGLKALTRVIHPYPVQADAIRQAANAWMRARLTPSVKRVTSQVLQWRR
jgi:pyruvate/2-oxoglutarate dehydrogenase complex dihydrolipoamide dehydrogenase (E3) component